MSPVTISGAVSGLDTATIINQLVSVQTNQQTLLRSQQSDAQKRADAYSSLVTSLNGLASQAKDLSKTSAWNAVTASSSSTSVTATASGKTAGALTFDVTSVAAAHTIISLSSLGSTGDLAASGPLTLTKSDGTAATIQVGTGSLSDVVSAINSSGSGVTATAVRTGAGAYRLQVAATTPGEASSFTLDGLDGFSGTDVLTQGSNATISVGSNPATAYTVTSETNTFADLVPGLSFTVSKLETGVSVSSAIDGTAIAAKVSKLVDSSNAILSGITAKTAYDVTTKTGGPLTGESTVRSLQQNLLSAVSLSGAPGVSLTRDGKLTFDQSRFLTAFSADPASVARAFGAAATFTPASGAEGTTATVSSALPTSRAGRYDIRVDSLADREQWQADVGGSLAGKTITLARGTATVNYTATDTDTLASVVAAFNARASASGFGVSASVSNTSLLFTADAVGSGSQFTLDASGAAIQQLSVGADITGSIDGQTANGLGSVLSLPTGSGGAVGLSIEVSTNGADVTATGGDLGTLTFSPGLAQRFTTLLSDATGSTGTVTTAEDGANSEVKHFQTQIDAWDSRLTAYRQTLTTQFTAMETALARLKTSMSALSQLTGSSSTSSSTSSTSSSG